MPAGRLVATAFFALLDDRGAGFGDLDARGSGSGLDRRLGWTRRSRSGWRWTCFVAGLATVLSFNPWDDLHPLGGIPRYTDATIYDLLDDATSQLLLPLGGLALAVFTGWMLPARILGEELELRGAALTGLRMMLRVVAPLAILAAVLASVLG